MKNEITVDGITYKKKENELGEYKIVRCRYSSPHAGYVVKREGSEVTMKDARRLNYWKGAATLSQLSQEGVKYPKECKFPCEEQEILLLDAIEIISCTKEAEKNIKEVPVWAI